MWVWGERTHWTHLHWTHTRLYASQGSAEHWRTWQNIKREHAPCMFWLRGERTVIRKCGLVLFCLLIKPSIYCGCITEVCALSVYPSTHTHKRPPTHTCSASSCSPSQFWLIAQMYVSWSWQLTMCNVNWQSRCHGMRACAFLRPVAQEASSTALHTIPSTDEYFSEPPSGRREIFFFFCWRSSASCLISCSLSHGPKVLQFCSSCGVSAIHNG